MITCKEDLLNTYIENDNGQLKLLYTKACYDASIEKGSNSVNEGLYMQVWDGKLIHTNSHDNFKQLTLAVFKPKTKVEYVTAKYDSAWKAVKDFEDGVELFSDSLGAFNRVYDIQHVVKYYNSFCHKVETELTWQDEVNTLLDSSVTSPLYQVMDSCEDLFIEMCHLVSNANK